MKRSLLTAMLISTAIFLSACDSSEERAEKHYQEGVKLLEAGDVDRALVEFRNVFRLEGTHKEARRRYAQAEIDRGNVRAGYSQYLRLVEQYPDDIAARRELTRLALKDGQWEEVEKHSAFLANAPADDDVRLLADLGLRYRQAVLDEDAAAQATLVAEALALRETVPSDPMIAQMLADYYVREGRREEALDELAQAISLSDDPRRFYMLRLALLQEMGDLDAVESDLRSMVELYPDDNEIAATLIRWLIAQSNIDDAESFLRDRGNTKGTSEKIDLVRFLVQFRDRDVAIAELDSLILKDAGSSDLYRSVRAGLIFEAGQQEEAIAELQSIVDAATEENDQLHNVKIALAQMLEQTGNSVGARALVEDVLASDANHVAALKMKATWLIDADETDEAILSLRTALEQNPRDPSLMTMLAQAYERAGNRALMAEMLSLAVEVSNNAPEETQRYARYLVADGKQDIAERTLVDSLRLNPGNTDLLAMLSNIYLGQNDWARANQIADTLAGLGTDQAESASNSLRAQILASQGRSDDVVGFLENLVDAGEAGVGAQVAIIRTHIQNGDVDAAMRYVDDRLKEEPEAPVLRFLKGTILELQGQSDEAEAMFTELTDTNPESVLVWRALYLLQQREGRGADATATIDRALAANPEASDLLWIRASELQRSGDLEGALGIYEAMYDRDSSAPVVANNYASLLTMLRDDPESIDRAYSVARRLRGLDVPAFQDTFGWIAYLRGEYDAALEHLVPAAEALTGDASVQYHLGMAYEALERPEDARISFQKAVDLGEAGSTVPEVAKAQEKLAELAAAGQ